MTQGCWPAVKILAEAHAKVKADPEMDIDDCIKGQLILARAIRHLMYPDRDVYPKTRRGTKGAPIQCQRNDSTNYCKVRFRIHCR